MQMSIKVIKIHIFKTTIKSFFRAEFRKYFGITVPKLYVNCSPVPLLALIMLFMMLSLLPHKYHSRVKKLEIFKI